MIGYARARVCVSARACLRACFKQSCLRARVCNLFSWILQLRCPILYYGGTYWVSPFSATLTLFRCHSSTTLIKPKAVFLGEFSSDQVTKFFIVAVAVWPGGQGVQRRTSVSRTHCFTWLWRVFSANKYSVFCLHTHTHTYTHARARANFLYLLLLFYILPLLISLFNTRSFKRWW